MRIHKFQLGITDRQDIYLPEGARILTAQIQSGYLCLWAEVDETAARKQAIQIAIYGTGHDMPYDPGRYIATVQNGQFVWHVYAI